MSRAVLAVLLRRVGCIGTYCICTAAIAVAMVLRSVDAENYLLSGVRLLYSLVLPNLGVLDCTY